MLLLVVVVVVVRAGGGYCKMKKKLEGGWGCFSFEGQYSTWKSLISTCVLSYIVSREYRLFDRVCES